MGIHRTDPLALAALATAAVPGLDLVATRLDQLGADFAFAEVDDASGRTWIVRMPLHDAAEAGQEAELTLLKALAGASSGGALPFEVPRPRGSASFDGGGVGIVYPRLPGVPVVMELMPAGPGIAESLGRAIAAFHQLPPAVVTEAGMPALTPSLYRHRLMAEVADAVRTGHVSERLHNRWREQLERDDWWVFTPVPIHGDMAPEHLLHHSDRISAMADFASVQVSDPAEDLAQILAPLPPDLAGTIVGAYRARRSDLEDPHLEDRAAFLGEIAIIRWLQHGLALGDEEIVRDARHMLADLDRAVREELEAKERAAAVEAAARARLEEAKLTAERESQERRDAAARASRAAAREHERNTGSQSASPIDAPEWRRPDDADRSSDPAAAWLADPSVTDRAGGADGLGGPPRKAVSDGGVSVWGKPRRPSAEQDAGEEPGLGGGGLVEVGSVESGTGGGDAGLVEAGSSGSSTRAGDAGQVEAGSSGSGTGGGDAGRTTGGGDGGPGLGGARGSSEELADSGPSGGRVGGDTAGEAGRGAGAAATAGPAAVEASAAATDEPDSQELTQAFLPDFLKDDSEAPEDIAAAAGRDSTEAFEGPARPA